MHAGIALAVLCIVSAIIVTESTVVNKCQGKPQKCLFFFLDDLLLLFIRDISLF